MTPPDATPEPTPSDSRRPVRRWWLWTVVLSCIWLPLLVFGLLLYRWHGHGLRLGDILRDISYDRLTQLAAGVLLVTPVVCAGCIGWLRRWRPGYARQLIASHLVVAGLSAGTVGYAGFLWVNPDASPGFMGNPSASCANCRSFIHFPLEAYAATHEGWYPRGGRDEFDSLARCLDAEPHAAMLATDFTSHAQQPALGRYWAAHHTFTGDAMCYRYVEGLRFDDDQGVLLYYDHPTYWECNIHKTAVLGRPVMDTTGEWDFIEESVFQKRLADTLAFLRAHPAGSRDEPSVEQALRTAMLMCEGDIFGTLNASEGGGPDGIGHETIRYANAEWRTGTPGPAPLDPLKPYTYLYAFLGKRGLLAHRSVPVQTFRAKGADYELLIVVAASDEAYASRARKIFNDAFARWHPVPAPVADAPVKSLPAVQP